MYHDPYYKDSYRPLPILETPISMSHPENAPPSSLRGQVGSKSSLGRKPVNRQALPRVPGSLSIYATDLKLVKAGFQTERRVLLLRISILHDRIYQDSMNLSSSSML